MRRYDAVIVGAGPAGSTAAILLARAGWSVALVEKQRFRAARSAANASRRATCALLDALGVGAEFDARGRARRCAGSR